MNDLYLSTEWEATNDFRSLKENIRWAIVDREAGPGSILFRPAQQPLAIRLQVEPENGRIQCFLLNQWNYPELNWGNFMFERLLLENGTTLSVKLSPNFSPGEKPGGGQF